MKIQLEALRSSLEGVVASVLATCDREGTPNVSMISQVHYVNGEHVALSYQFFNKTRRNLMDTRFASVQILDPQTFAQHRLDLEFVETQTSGPVFESMKAKLAGIASHHGMENVFRLLGADIFKVTSIEAVPGPQRLLPSVARPLLSAARNTCAALDSCADLDELLDSVCSSLETHFGITNAMVLMVESQADKLYTVASKGYPQSGVGSEVSFGEGVIGVAARENTPIRIGHMTREYSYSAAVSETARRAGIIFEEAEGIRFPGLLAPRSQIALPIADRDRILGVIFAESEEMMRFGYEDEDALALVAGHLAARIALLPQDADDSTLEEAARPASSDGVTVRMHPADQSIFLGNDYLIKGVAGAILWRLLREHAATGRVEFTTRELRMEPSLRLPLHAENFDARLILLRKRLEERQACVQIKKSGRGRFRIVTNCPFTLAEISETSTT
jgi:adenylate cyclase